jgi:hypothetical protein
MTDTSSTSYGGPAGTSGRHPVDIGHLVMGVAFLGMVGVWALFEGGIVEGDDLNWFLPLPWLAAGAAGLAAVTVNSRRRARREAAAEEAAHAAGWGQSYEQPYQPYEPYRPYDTYAPSYDPPSAPPDQPADHPDTTPDRPDNPEENR